MHIWSTSHFTHMFHLHVKQTHMNECIYIYDKMSSAHFFKIHYLKLAISSNGIHSIWFLLVIYFYNNFLLNSFFHISCFLLHFFRLSRDMVICSNFSMKAPRGNLNKKFKFTRHYDFYVDWIRVKRWLMLVLVHWKLKYLQKFYIKFRHKVLLNKSFHKQ